MENGLKQQDTVKSGRIRQNKIKKKTGRHWQRRLKTLIYLLYREWKTIGEWIECSIWLQNVVEPARFSQDILMSQKTIREYTQTERFLHPSLQLLTFQLDAKCKKSAIVYGNVPMKSILFSFFLAGK